MDNIGVLGLKFGYPFADGAQVSIKIDNTSQFNLYTKDEEAWAYENEDEEIIRAMKKGLKMFIEGTSKRGTDTKDTYSLSGFSKAHGKILKICKNN